MLLRPRDLARVRADSLRIATKKIGEGCASCSESYLDLARRNGATEQEIVAARSSRATLTAVAPVAAPELAELPSSEISRRLFLKGLAATGAGLGMWPRLTTAMAVINDEEASAKIPVVHHEKAGVGPFGVDSNTGPASGRLPINFYIGEMGYGECENNGPCFNGTRRGPCATRVTRGTACFNIATAHVATPSYTYGYWGLQGPGKNPGRGGAYDWGAAQGVAAVDAWVNGSYSNVMFGQTIFADVESGFGGWMDPQVVPNAHALNGDVLNGFLDAVANQDQGWDPELRRVPERAGHQWPQPSLFQPRFLAESALRLLDNGDVPRPFRLPPGRRRLRTMRPELQQCRRRAVQLGQGDQPRLFRRSGPGALAVLDQFVRLRR